MVEPRYAYDYRAMSNRDSRRRSPFGFDNSVLSAYQRLEQQSRHTLESSKQPLACALNIGRFPPAPDSLDLELQ